MKTHWAQGSIIVASESFSDISKTQKLKEKPNLVIVVCKQKLPIKKILF